MMMRVTRVVGTSVSARDRHVARGFGSAALSTSTVSAKGETVSHPPHWPPRRPLSTSSGCTNNLTSATGRNSRSERAAVRMLLRIQHCADGEQRYRRGRITEHAHDLLHRPRQGWRGGRDDRAGVIAQGQRVAQRHAQCGRRSREHAVLRGRLVGRAAAAPARGTAELVKTMSMRMQPISGPALFSPSSPDQQRKAHEAGVQEGRDQPRRRRRPSCSRRARQA